MKALTLPDLLVQLFVVVMSVWACYARWIAPKLRQRRERYHLLSTLLLEDAPPTKLTPAQVTQAFTKVHQAPPREATEEEEDNYLEAVGDQFDPESDDDEEEDTNESAKYPSLLSLASPVEFRPLPAKSRDVMGDWMAFRTKILSSANHLIVIGESGGGKTIAIQDFVAYLRFQGISCVVCDPDAAAGDWEGTQVFGAGDDFEAIDQACGGFLTMMKSRQVARAEGQRTFEPFWFVIDEYGDVKDACEIAGIAVEKGLRRARKLNMHLIIGVQDTQVKTMGFERKSTLLNHAQIVTMHLDLPTGVRTASLNQEAPIRVPDLTSGIVSSGSLTPSDFSLDPTRISHQTAESRNFAPIEPTGEEDDPTDKDEAIAALLSLGWSYGRITKTLQVSTTRISKVKKELLIETGENDEATSES